VGSEQRTAPCRADWREEIVTELPPPHLFSDPNDRLLASVMPGPPPPLGIRARRCLQQASSHGLRQVRRWLRRGVGSTTLLFAALAGLGVGIGGYLGVATRGSAAPTTVSGEARHVPPEAILPLCGNARVAALDPIPCAAGLAPPAPRVDDVNVPRAPMPHHVTRDDDAAALELRPPPRRRATEKKQRSEKLERRTKLEKRSTHERARGSGARHAKRPRAANAADVRSARR
jgi:hypothetical protein